MLPLPPLRVRGMHGLGDNIHQRGILRQLMAEYNVYLESSWVSIYHDLVKEGLKIIHKPTNLKYQTQNAVREGNLFYKGQVPWDAKWLVTWYRGDKVIAEGSVLGAMCKHVTGTAENISLDPLKADFRLPVPDEWMEQAAELIDSWNTGGKPIMIYRPLSIREEYAGMSRARNPDPNHYYDLFQSIRDKFYVVDIADLVHGQERVISNPIDADQTYHKGEIQFEQLAGLFKSSDLIYGSPGFAIPLAQAVETPVICVFGGFESSTSFILGARYTPTLSISPIESCGCWTDGHDCPKQIDMPKALREVASFVDDLKI